MPTQDPDDSQNNSMSEAMASALKAAQAVADTLHQIVEQGTETLGAVVTPIAENPLVRQATRVPGLSWLMAALGQVNVEKVQLQVDELRQKYPLDTAEQLAERIIAETAWKAAGVGLVTNFAPPLALFLAAVDVGAVAALQADMIYRIAAIYGFSVHDPARRGEVLALWGVSAGGSGVLKTGLSFVELIPGLGMAVGITSDAALLYGLGWVALRFYETKQKSGSSSDR
ncbi:MAG: EcsC family protein [Oscillatoriophycideae cyanobacterium NC_groundwater_1537_Pr4_S-0.65um_50_18]|nr:EcsC family protein [Oscillatoriophycideae cyanobacterium NC_groundwater_1537_Pr4_S-0.65um_50_18]